MKMKCFLRRIHKHSINTKQHEWYECEKMVEMVEMLETQYRIGEMYEVWLF